MADSFDPSSVNLLIRWLEHDVKKPNGKKHTLTDIANALGTDNNSLNRFLNHRLNSDEEIRRGEQLAGPLKDLLTQGRPFPKAVSVLYEQVYGEDDPLQIDDALPVQRPEVLRHRSMARATDETDHLRTLLGVSVLVRTANELVPPTEAYETDDQHGWSVAILNVIPTHLQEGFNHPLFKLRQRGRNGTSSTIEGIVITRDDRFVFQGIDTVRRLPFNATLRLPDDIRHYRRVDPKKDPVLATGVMLGLRSEGGAFGALFELFAVPEATLPEDATDTQKEAFRVRYRAALDAAGVRNLDETVAQLTKLGIADKGWLKDKLRTMRDRSMNSPVLTAF